MLLSFFFATFFFVNKGMQKRHLLRRYFSAQRKTGSETSPPRPCVAVPIEAFFAYTSEKGFPTHNCLPGMALFTDYAPWHRRACLCFLFTVHNDFCQCSGISTRFQIPHLCPGSQPRPELKVAGPTAKYMRTLK
jgi:hypothetical protein